MIRGISALLPRPNRLQEAVPVDVLQLLHHFRYLPQTNMLRSFARVRVGSTSPTCLPASFLHMARCCSCAKMSKACANLRVRVWGPFPIQ